MAKRKYPKMLYSIVQYGAGKPKPIRKRHAATWQRAIRSAIDMALTHKVATLAQGPAGWYAEIIWVRPGYVAIYYGRGERNYA